MTHDERVPHEILLAYAEDMGQPQNVREMAFELLLRRGNEYVCPQCGLRQVSEEDQTCKVCSGKGWHSGYHADGTQALVPCEACLQTGRIIPF